MAAEHLDVVPRHVEQARQASQAQPNAPLASVDVGDARQLDRPDASVDAVLLFGPLYHLTAQRERVAALRETRRILRPEGMVNTGTQPLTTPILPRRFFTTPRS